MIAILSAPIKWLKGLYAWTIHWSNAPHALTALFCIAFIESSFFPIPPDVLLITIVVSNNKKWLKAAAICTIGSVCGAVLGYFIGWGLFETVGRMIIETYHMQSAVEYVGRKFTENAFLTVFTAAFTPIPYKAITISAGIFKIPILTLVIASIIGRAGRFFMVAGALRIFGKKISDSIEKYFDIFSIVFILLIIGGVEALKCLTKQ